MEDDGGEDGEDLLVVSKEDVEFKRQEGMRLHGQIAKSDTELRQRSKICGLLKVQVAELEQEVRDKQNTLETTNEDIGNLMVGIKETDERTDLFRQEIAQMDEQATDYIAQQHPEMERAVLAEHASADLVATFEADRAEEKELNSAPKVVFEEDDEEPTVLEGLVEVCHLNSACLFYVPKHHNFGDLLQDSIKYWNVAVEKVGLEDEEGRVWVHSALVQTEMNLSERFLNGKVPQVFLRFKELDEEEEEDDNNWMTKKKKEAIEVVEEMDAAEAMKLAEVTRLRSQAQKELFFYLVFVLAFLVVTLSWRDTQLAYQVANAVKTAVLDEDFPESEAHFQKSFYDVANGEEMYIYLKEIFIPGVNLGEGAEEMGGYISEYNRLVGTIRLRQLRVGDGKACIVPSKYSSDGQLGCYAPYSSASHTSAPYGPDGRYQADLGNPMSKSVAGKLATYPAGGFTLDFPLEHHNFSAAVRELEATGWVDGATRAVFVELVTYNVNINMFTCVQIVFEYSAGGLVYPWARFLSLVIVEEQPFWTGAFVAVMKFLYYVYILYFIKRVYDEVIASRNSTDPPNCMNFICGWNMHELLILALALTTIVLGILYQIDPVRDTLNIESTTEWQDLFPMAETAEFIIQLNAILSLLIFWKIFKYLNLSSRFVALSNTLSTALPEVVTFLIMFGVVFVAYGFMANLLFGVALEQYTSFERTLITLFLVTLGEFDYAELDGVTRIFAPIFFFTFIVFVFFVLLNMFIGIVGEAYNVESAKPVIDLSDEFADFLGDVKDSITQPIAEFIEAAKEKLKEMKKIAEEQLAKRNAEIRRESVGRGMVNKLAKNELPELSEKAERLWLLPTEIGQDDLIMKLNLARTATTDEKGNEREPQENMTEKQAIEKYIEMLYENIDEAKELCTEVTKQGMRDEVNMFEMETAACESLVEEFEAQIVAQELALEDAIERAKAERAAKKAAEAAENEDGSDAEGEDGAAAEGEDGAAEGGVKEEANPLLKSD